MHTYLCVCAHKIVFQVFVRWTPGANFGCGTFLPDAGWSGPWSQRGSFESGGGGGGLLFLLILVILYYYVYFLLGGSIGFYGDLTCFHIGGLND